MASSFDCSPTEQDELPRPTLVPTTDEEREYAEEGEVGEEKATEKVNKKRRRHFGRGIEGRRILHTRLQNNLHFKSTLSEDELAAFADMKTFDAWVPVSPLDLLDLCLPGDWVVFSKPKYTDGADSSRKRVVCRVADKSDLSISFETIASRELVPKYEWSFQWSAGAMDEDLAAAVTGSGKRQYYMRMPSLGSVTSKKRPAKKKTFAYICASCGWYGSQDCTPHVNYPTEPSPDFESSGNEALKTN
jgi:hypothetical protein